MTASVDLLQLSDERDRYIRRILAAFTEGWRACEIAHGWDHLRAEPMDVDEPASWPQVISPEVDRQRYPPNGRARFGDPRPGDFLGRAS